MITKTMKNRIVVAFLCLVLLFSAFFPLLPIRASAESTEHTGVLEDLERDESFDPTKYPDNPNDNSLQVITLAEGANGELYVYVYQPSHKIRDLVATEIRMSIPRVGVDMEVKDYKLELVSTEGVFDKYKVLDVTVDTSMAVRYYDVIHIARAWVKGVDEELAADNTASTVPYEVSKQWTFQTVDGEQRVSVLEIETIEITDKFVGYIRYENKGWELYPSACDSHFVAFSLAEFKGKKIDKLMEADLTYVSQDWIIAISSGLGGTVKTEPKGNPETIPVFLKHDDQPYKYDGHGWFAETYTWDYIQTYGEFKTSTSGHDITFTEEASKELLDTDFVLRFANTDYELFYEQTLGASWEDITKISDVSILRLKFEAEGVVYNVGVVDNKQTGSDNPAGTNKDDDDWFKKIMQALMFIGVIILVTSFFEPVKAVVGVVIDGSMSALQAVIDIVIWPFQAIGDLFKGKRR